MKKINEKIKAPQIQYNITSLFNDVRNNTPNNDITKKETPIEIRRSTLRIKRLFTYLSKRNSFINLNNFTFTFN